MENKQTNNNNIFWGILFILCGVFFLLSKLGIISYFIDISVSTMLFTIVFLWMLIDGLRRRNSFEVIFGIAFLIIIYAEPLNITALSSTNILCAALLLSIGFSLIIGNRKKNISYGSGSEHVFNENDDSVINFKNSFSSSTKYINTDEFISANLDSSFGELKVYFDNAVIKNGVADVNVNVSFGHIAIYVPSTWKIENYISASCGAVTEKNSSNTTGSPVLKLHGNVSFGELSIFYI